MTRERVKAVLDTNVIVSTAIRPESIPAYAVAAGISGKFLICYSDEIVVEYREVLTRGKFKLPSRTVETFIADIKHSGRKVTPRIQLSICSDPNDNKFLECAEEVPAHYLVTGNRRHPAGRDHGTTKVVTPREFVTILISAGII